ncbi:hypothetical protein, partial [Shewanella algae]|uniref:hypothetical protein n=1 Tax=Shewanella algae TaxID=38313 RepID=UPI00313E131C
SNAGGPPVEEPITMQLGLNVAKSLKVNGRAAGPVGAVAGVLGAGAELGMNCKTLGISSPLIFSCAD